MVTTQEYDDAKRELADITQRLQTERLTNNERHNFQRRAYQISAWLFRPWLPVYWSRRLIMLGIFILGLYQMWIGYRYGFLLWLLALPFSPRVMGQIAYLIGRTRGQLSR